MDIRKQADYEEKQKVANDEQNILGVLDRGLIVSRAENIHDDPRYLDSLVFSLVGKLDTLDEITRLYEEKRKDATDSYFTATVRQYVHTSHILPATVLFLAYLKYKRRLNLHTGTLVISAATAINEFSKHYKMKKLDPKLTEKYDNHAQSYSYLFYNFNKYAPRSYILQYGFGIDLKPTARSMIQRLRVPKHVDEFYMAQNAL
eukprot:TRINITY_DN11055_c0_g1_i4.p1 TRINITY_DN11055_c0_g1~~TRINITY_DN11055_c0_g1_i4.p1  ORF type:complete len:203 (+),score=31.25 TRINITY_DN11055_c0_g1_i4:40-648(+)